MWKGSQVRSIEFYIEFPAMTLDTYTATEAKKLRGGAGSEQIKKLLTSILHFDLH